MRAGKNAKGRTTRNVKGGDDWDLDTEGEGVEYLDNREDLPVLVTLNLVPGSTAFFLDATPQEESTCLDRVHLFFNASGRVCGIRTEGTEGLDATRVRGLLEVSTDLVFGFFAVFKSDRSSTRADNQEGKRIAGELISSLNAQIPQ